MTDLWFRNPDRALNILAEEGVSRITWTRQHLGRLRTDGIAIVRQFYMHTPIRPKIMLIGIQGSAEYHLFSKLDEPLAVYPTWSGKHDSIDELLNWIENPWGDDMYRCSDLSTPSSLRPVWGQKHRVIIHNMPSTQSGPGRQAWLRVLQVQKDYPDVDLFINGSKSFSVMFGMRFKAVDEGISDAGDNNRIFRLPNGVAIKLDNPDGLSKLIQFQDWVKLLGFEPKDLVADAKNRFRFRVRSARWAAKHWANNFRWHLESRNLIPEDQDVSDDEYDPKDQTKSIVLRRKIFTLREADKILCSRCRIQAGCRFYRAESICGMDDSPMSDLAKYFDSRNAGRIVDGLAHMLRIQAERLERAMASEEAEEDGKIDPEVTKLVKAVFDGGVKLAKLVDPNLAGPGTKVQVNVGTGVAASTDVIAGDPRQVIAVIVDTLEKGGIKREEITSQMVIGVLQGMANQSQQQAITAEVVKYEDAMGSPKGKQKNSDSVNVVLSKK